MVNNVSSVYDSIADTYDQKYVEGEDNPYMEDEAYVADVWKKLDLPTGRILSLGCGTGQDVEILGYPDPEKYLGIDVSPKMLERARLKFGRDGYVFKLADVADLECPFMYRIDCDILVAMFGVPNYITLERLSELYEVVGAEHGFFVFYNEEYRDGISDHYNFSIDQIRQTFKHHNPFFEEFSNYVVCAW